MDEGCDIHTPTKITYPQITDPNSPIQAQCSSWQVYSRKRMGKKKQAQLCAVNSPQEAIASEITTIQSHHQKMAEKQTEGQLSNSMQQHMAQSQLRHDGEFQSANHYQDAESTWRMVTELGMTTRNSQKNYVQQLLELERRDVDEVERLGSRRQNQ